MGSESWQSPQTIFRGSSGNAMSPEQLISGGFMGSGSSWIPPTTGSSGYFQGAPTPLSLPMNTGNFIDPINIVPGNPLYNPLYPSTPAPSPMDLIKAMQSA
mgnify:CR=1 FL=1